MASPASVYRPLRAEQHEIRLLKLLPAEDLESEIECELLYTTLNDPLPYEALSYTWGRVDFTHAIVLDGPPFKITANLDAALRHLRLPSGSGRVLWVDAVCINQADVGERSHQVTLMKNIYQRCRADLAWLGPNPSDLEVSAKVVDPEERRKKADAARKQQEARVQNMARGMALMRKIFDKDITTLEGMRKKWDDEYAREWRTVGDGKDHWMVSYEDEMALVSLFSSPRIWKRIWVMQELSCAPKVVLVGGKETLDWDYIASFLGDTPYADAFHISWSHGSTAPMVRQVFDRVQTIQHQRGIMKEVAANGFKSTVMDVLARFKFASSTDPRDKIYGLLGLVSEKHNIRVDYSKPVEHVFAEVTRHLIDSTANLDIICQNPWQIDDWDKKTDGLASWTADFTYSGYKDILNDGWSGLLFAQRDVFSAGIPSLQVPCQVIDDTTLKTEGVILGHVDRVLEEDYHYTKEEAAKRPQRYRRWSKMPRDWMQLYFGNKLVDDRTLQYPATGEPALQAYWRTLVTDCRCYKIRRLNQAEIEADGALFNMILGREPEEDENGRDQELESLFGKLASNWMWERNYLRWTFGVSDNGLYMLLRRGTQEGDVIAVLDGGKVPVVLRLIEGPAGVRYRVINSAYVHGYMDGEAVRETTNGRLQRQEFLLI